MVLSVIRTSPDRDEYCLFPDCGLSSLSGRRSRRWSDSRRALRPSDLAPDWASPSGWACGFFVILDGGFVEPDASVAATGLFTLNGGGPVGNPESRVALV